jgi:hypothetical protein
MLVVVAGVVYEISADVVALFIGGVYSIAFLIFMGWAWVHDDPNSDHCAGSQHEDEPACNPQLIGG